MTEAAPAPAVSVIAELVRAAGHQPQEEVMTHGDITPDPTSESERCVAHLT
jgi:hypothetical protein